MEEGRRLVFDTNTFLLEERDENCRKAGWFFDVT